MAELAVDLRRVGKADVLVDFLGVDIEFHQLILDASGNDTYRSLREGIAEVLGRRGARG